MYISGYRCMWVVAMFDLPVNTKKARCAYADFVKFLTCDGFTRMQFRSNACHSASKENAEVHVHRIQGNLPPDGEVRILTVTDKQYEAHECILGKFP